MELNLLKDLLAVSDMGNFSRAANARNVSQPAFSRRIKALETWVGVPLVNRSEYPVTLTEAGAVFRDYAAEIIQRLQTAKAEAAAAHKRTDSAVQIAMPHALAMTFFPTWWNSLSAGMDKARARVITFRHYGCADLLAQGASDFFLCFHYDGISVDLDAVDFPFKTVGADVLMPVSAPNTNGEPRFALSRHKRGPIPTLSYTANAFLGHVVSEIMLRNNGMPYLEPCYEDSFTASQRAAVIAGVGLAWLPRSVVAADLASGALVQAGGPEFCSSLDIRLYRSSKEAQPAVELMWDMVDDQREIATQAGSPTRPKQILVAKRSLEANRSLFARIDA